MTRLCKNTSGNDSWMVLLEVLRSADLAGCAAAVAQHIVTKRG